MPDLTLKDGFQQAKTNLTAIAQLVLTDSAGTFSYVVPQEPTNPIIEFFITGHRYTRLAAQQQQYDVGLRMRVIVERLLAGYDGQVQDAGQWDYYPTMIEGFEKYASLKPPNGTPVPFLDTLNTTLVGGNPAIEGQNFVIILNWNLVFKTSINRC